MRLLPVLAVELRPEETRCALEHFVGSAKLADLLLGLPHPPGLDGRHPGNVTLINVGWSVPEKVDGCLGCEFKYVSVA